MHPLLNSSDRDTLIFVVLAAALLGILLGGT